MIPLYGYSKKSEKLRIDYRACYWNTSGLTAIIETNIFLAIQFFKGGVTARDFAKKEIKENLSNYVFFMDNARIHKAKIQIPFFNNINILYNAAYSP